MSGIYLIWAGIIIIIIIIINFLCSVMCDIKGEAHQQKQQKKLCET
jgi:hypothetical protein